MFRKINSLNGVTALQNGIDTIFNCCPTWQMELNVYKCKVLRISWISYSPATYSLNSIPLRSVTTYCYLGVHITTCSSWSLHTRSIIINANRMLRYICRNFFTAPVLFKLLMYNTLICSKIEYAAAVWDPSSSNLINALELIQNNSVCFILHNYSRHTSIYARKNSLEQPSLASPRMLFRHCLFHKICHHVPTLRNALIFQPFYVPYSIDHSNEVGVMSCLTKTCSDSIIPEHQ